MYSEQARSCCLMFDWQIIFLADSLTFDKAGIRILISNAIIEITTSNSTSVKAFLFDSTIHTSRTINCIQQQSSLFTNYRLLNKAMLPVLLTKTINFVLF